MSCINREEAIRLIMEYQGGAMDKPTAKKVLEGMDGVEICEDTISSQAAIDAVESAKTARTPDGEIYVAKLNAEMNIQILPSAQPEIIRCKDCKYYEIAWLKKDGTDNKRYKPSICVKGRYGITRKPDWFCADAERREDEG